MVATAATAAAIVDVVIGVVDVAVVDWWFMPLEFNSLKQVWRNRKKKKENCTFCYLFMHSGAYAAWLFMCMAATFSWAQKNTYTYHVRRAMMGSNVCCLLNGHMRRCSWAVHFYFSIDIGGCREAQAANQMIVCEESSRISSLRLMIHFLFLKWLNGFRSLNARFVQPPVSCHAIVWTSSPSPSPSAVRKTSALTLD